MKTNEPNRFGRDRADERSPGSAVRPRARFSGGLAVNMLMVGVMVGSIAYSLDRFLPLVVALPVAVAIAGSFSHIVHQVLAPELSQRHRVIGALVAGAIFIVTCALSYGSLYASLFAEQSALRHFEAGRLPLIDRLNAQMASAETAQKALQAWAEDSRKKAQKESGAGGTCSNKSESSAIRGPIAIWRESEMAIAANLADDFRERLKAARASLDPVRDALPTTYAESLTIGAQVNHAVEVVEALAHGAFAESVVDTLKRQSASRITWRKDETFLCGDSARDELLTHAFNAAARLQAAPALQPLKPAIDLRSDKEVMVRGLLRGFNLAAAIMTLGRRGSFEDDPLMAQALQGGWINRETLGFLLAALIEASIVLSATWARRRGAVPFPFVPEEWMQRATARESATPGTLARTLLGVCHALARALFNIFYAVPDGREGTATVGSDAVADSQLPERALRWADLLLPWIYQQHRAAYVCVPVTQSTELARTAALCLTDEGRSVLLSTSATWQQICGSPGLAHRVSTRQPHAKEHRFEVYRLLPGTAQAFRLHYLQPESPQPATMRGITEIATRLDPAT